MAKTITALKIEPNKHPCVVRLRTDTHELEYAVSIGASYLCQPAVCHIDDGVAVLYNKEAALLGLPGNRSIGMKVIAGTFYVVGVDEKSNLASLSHEQVDFYWMWLFMPEQISDDDVASSNYDQLLGFDHEL